jgi:hypothetical protein
MGFSWVTTDESDSLGYHFSDLLIARSDSLVYLIVLMTAGFYRKFFSNYANGLIMLCAAYVFYLFISFQFLNLNF